MNSNAILTPASLVLVTVMLCSFVHSCKTEEPTPGKMQHITCDTSPVTYDGTVKAIMEQHCSIEGCHTRTNGGVFPLDTYEQVRASGLYDSFIGSLKQTDSAFKPMPYPAGSPKLSEQEITCLEAWIADGLRESN